MIFASIFVILVCASQNAHALSNDSADIEATREVIKITSGLIKSGIQNNDLQSAEQYSKFATDYYSNRVNELRDSGVQSADELHLLLIDIHSKISNKQTDSIESDLNSVSKYLEGFPESPQKGQTISEILEVANKLYRNGISNNNPSEQVIAVNLVDVASNMIDSSDEFDLQKKTELREFFIDLIPLMNQKKEIASVDKIITSIQQELVVNESISTDNEKIYDKIEDLYGQAKIELNNNNYAKADELVTSAYLDNFEFLESDIGKSDHSLLEKMEVNMRDQIREMIQEKKSPQDIIVFIDGSILEDLKKSKQLLSDAEHGSESDKTKPSVNEPVTEQQKLGVRSDIDTIRDKLETMLSQYSDRDYSAAFTSARSAYLDSYEHIEVPLRSIDPDFTLQVELEFSQLRELIGQKAEYARVQDAAVKVRHSLDESERLVTGTGQIAPAIAFSSSFAVIFREGLESVLILGAILTYLEASRNTKYKKFVYQGIGLAAIATAVTWAIASYIINISGTNRELIEAIAALSATAVLFYVSFWILNKIEHKKWMEFVKAKVWQASATGGVMVFVMLSFFTVYREGFETVLFYEAMFGFAKHMEFFVGAGFVLGIGVLLAVYFVTRKLGKRLPLKILFGLTMGVGAYLSVAFLGNAIRELQNLDILPFTSLLGIIPRLDINIAKMTGIYPTLESLIGQAILAGVYLIAASYVLIVRPKQQERIEGMRKSRKEVDEFETH